MRGEVTNNRGIICPVMALTTAQRPLGRDHSTSQKIRRERRLFPNSAHCRALGRPTSAVDQPGTTVTPLNSDPLCWSKE